MAAPGEILLPTSAARDFRQVPRHAEPCKQAADIPWEVTDRSLGEQVPERDLAVRLTDAVRGLQVDDRCPISVHEPPDGFGEQSTQPAG